MAKKRLEVKQKDRVASEQKLLQAAEEVFSKHGFEGAITRDIAEKAGVNLALIARYFDGKYGLLLALLSRKREEMQRFEPREKKNTLTEECINYGFGRIEEMCTNLQMFRIVLAQFITDEKFLKRYHETMSLEFPNDYIYERIQDLIKQKKVNPKCDPKFLIDVLERNIVSIVLFEIVIRKISKQEALDLYERFASEYVKQFER